MKLFKRIIGTLGVLALLISCGGNSAGDQTDNNETPDANPEKLTIAAAASTQFAVRELAKVFSEKNNGFTVDVIIGSSGKLTTQIINGAPYDVFFAANMKYPNKVFSNGMAKSDPIIFGFGVPTLWTMDSSLELNSEGKFLLSENIKKIAIAEPTNAPYGEMAINFFKKSGVYEQLESRLVYGESISQVNEYIMKEAAQVGVSAKSIIISPEIENKGIYLPLERAYWVPQGVVELKNNGSSPIKTQLMDFIVSEEGIAILKKYGYEK